MLVLSRKLDDTIIIGDQIEIKVVSIRGGVVRLGISAPESVKVMRSEILDRKAPALRETNGLCSETVACSLTVAG
ncbi:MAG TPA: carbon storage regulator [Planctomycetaceae bacterium]|nr:carbon storage regulator [Planctomycetaceae bacterium]